MHSTLANMPQSGAFSSLAQDTRVDQKWCEIAFTPGFNGTVETVSAAKVPGGGWLLRVSLFF